MSMLYLFFVLFLGLYLEKFEVWFQLFCIFCGNYLVVKGLLFRSDSSLHFGLIVFSWGLMSILGNLFDFGYNAIYLFVALALSSFLTFMFFKRIGYLFLGLLGMYESVTIFMFLSKVINFLVFLSINLSIFFLFLFICVIVFKKIKSRS